MAAASSRLLDDRHGSRDQEPPEGSRWPILDILPSLGLHLRNRQATRPAGARHEGILLYPQAPNR